jgi:hypothetical protein
LYYNLTGGYNTAVGLQALYSSSTGSYSSAVGYQALYNYTGTAINDAFGSKALQQTTTGGYNTAVGFQSALNTTTGSYNTVVGRDALYNNTTASNNTAVGYQAGYSNTTGLYGTFIGYQAGYTSPNGDGNVLVGYQAGYALTTGNYVNTFVGYQSGNAVTTGNRNTILGRYSGNQGGLDIRTSSNYIVLSDGDGNPRAYHNATDWNTTTSRVISQKGMGPYSYVTLAAGASTTVTVSAACLLFITPDGGSVQTGALFTCKASGGSKGCYVLSQATAGYWGFGTTSDPGTGTARVWVSADLTMTIKNASGSSFGFYVIAMATSE